MDIKYVLMSIDLLRLMSNVLFCRQFTAGITDDIL